MHDRARTFWGIQPKGTPLEKPIEIAPDPPINIHSVSGNSEGCAPFYIALEVNQLILHNFMLDSGAEVNVMPLRVMEQLELTPSSPFRNVCGMDS